MSYSYVLALGCCVVYSVVALSCGGGSVVVEDVGSLGRGNFTAGLLLSHSGRKCGRFAAKIEMVSVQGKKSMEPTKTGKEGGGDKGKMSMRVVRTWLGD